MKSFFSEFGLDRYSFMSSLFDSSTITVNASPVVEFDNEYVYSPSQSSKITLLVMLLLMSTEIAFLTHNPHQE